MQHVGELRERIPVISSHSWQQNQSIRNEKILFIFGNEIMIISHFMLYGIVSELETNFECFTWATWTIVYFFFYHILKRSWSLVGKERSVFKANALAVIHFFQCVGLFWQRFSLGFPFFFKNVNYLRFFDRWIIGISNIQPRRLRFFTTTVWGSTVWSNSVRTRFSQDADFGWNHFDRRQSVWCSTDGNCDKAGLPVWLSG